MEIICSYYATNSELLLDSDGINNESIYIYGRIHETRRESIWKECGISTEPSSPQGIRMELI